jgi:hypothetical protein
VDSAFADRASEAMWQRVRAVGTDAVRDRPPAKDWNEALCQGRGQDASTSYLDKDRDRAWRR